MAAKKINKSAFVRGLSASMPAPEVVKAAAAKGIKLSVKFVHTIRYNAKVSAKKKSGGGAAPSVGAAGAVVAVKRGPGRPPKSASAPAAAHVSHVSHVSHASSGGLVGEIERIVERKVTALLKARLGALFA